MDTIWARYGQRSLRRSRLQGQSGGVAVAAPIGLAADTTGIEQPDHRRLECRLGNLRRFRFPLVGKFGGGVAGSRPGTHVDAARRKLVQQLQKNVLGFLVCRRLFWRLLALPREIPQRDDADFVTVDQFELINCRQVAAWAGL